jgi:hypothetical protein
MPKDRIMGSRASYSDFEPKPAPKAKPRSAPAPEPAKGGGGRGRTPSPTPTPTPAPRRPTRGPNDGSTRPGTRGQMGVGWDGEELKPAERRSGNRGG